MKQYSSGLMYLHNTNAYAMYIHLKRTYEKEFGHSMTCVKFMIGDMICGLI